MVFFFQKAYIFDKGKEFTRMKAQIINIGNELLNGYIVNTNAAWLAKQLETLGVELQSVQVISDHKKAISAALSGCLKSKSEVFIFTGGLGPTNDDITKKVLAQFFATRLLKHKATLQAVKKYFKSKNRPVLKVNKEQALVPEIAQVLPNALGTAPGLYIENKQKHFFFLPGVPYEMKHLFSTYIEEILNKKSRSKIVTLDLITKDIGESLLSKKIKPWEKQLKAKSMTLAYLPKPGFVTLRLTKKGKHRKVITREIKREFESLKIHIKPYISEIKTSYLNLYLKELLLQKKKTIALAESCTGGFISHLLTTEPGASSFYKGSIVAYDNAVKTDLLGVNTNIIKAFGAVSEKTVEKMAKKLLKTIKSDYGISVSGIAGPSGGSKEKPVGLVCFGFSNSVRTIVKRQCFKGSRKQIISFAAEYALRKMIHLIEKDHF